MSTVQIPFAAKDGARSGDVIRRCLLVACGLMFAAVLVPRTAGAAGAATYTSAISEIRSADLKRHVVVLASDTLEGREAGSRGGKAAGIYLTEQLEAMAAPPAGVDGSYFQHFGADYRNLLVLVSGSDPELRKEYVVVGGHYDHVGYGTKYNSQGPVGRIHNGADDNASGTAGMLELIQAFLSLHERPKRSLLFAFWDAEEKGLLGSEHWTQHPTVPLDAVRMAVNIDMIGRLRDETVEVYGVRTARGLRRLLSEQNRASELALQFNWDMERNSDHYPFLERRIPFLMLHTRKHDDYHRPSDDVDRLNFMGTEEVVRLTFRTVYELANAVELPEFRPASLRENDAARKRLRAGIAAAPARLGVSWNEQREGDHAIELTRVVPDSPAEKAGLQAGDRVLQFGEYAIGTSDFRELVMVARNPVRVVVERPGSEEPLELVVTLAGRPRRLGISWRQDDAEPDALILTGVVPGSAADRGGLTVGDRIYSVADIPAGSSEALRTLTGTDLEQVELVTERDGRTNRVSLALLPAAPSDSPAAP